MPIQYATLIDAKTTVTHFGGEPDSVVHLGNFSNSVFSFNDWDGLKRILRFTDARHRTLTEVIGELEFLQHLQKQNVPACAPVLFPNGSLTIQYAQDSSLIGTLLTFVPGVYVDESSAAWRGTLFSEWGRNLALIHSASRPYDSNPRKRWIWNKEDIFVSADVLIPANDIQSRKELDFVLNACMGVKTSGQSFGMIHADHAPQNFNFEPATGTITAFDFANCCYHWFLADLAISLSTVRRQANRQEIRDDILSGYGQVEGIPENAEEQIDLFIRLRVLYVYLHRLNLFGQSPDEAQRATLSLIRQRVHERKGW